MNKESILNPLISKLKSVLPELSDDFMVKKIGVFGSVVRGEIHDNSDIDILVEFSKPIGLFKFLELESYLEELIGQKVDLVSKKALKPYIGKSILNEVIYI